MQTLLKPALILGIVVAIAGAIAVAASAWRSSDATRALPTTVVTKGVFVDSLQVRGEIRPRRSVVLTAPSSSSDLQILELAANGAAVSPGDVVIQFDSTNQQRTLAQRQSELKQADSEVEKAEAEAVRRTRAAQAELDEARSAAARARLDVAKAEIVSRVEGEKLKIALANAEQKVKELQQKVEGERMASAADVAIARQKRNKADYDVRETTRIMSALTVRAPAAGSISILPNFRAGGMFGRSAPEFKRGDRAWFGAAIAELPDLTSIQMSCRLDEADRGRVKQGAAVMVRVDAVPDRELRGTLHEIPLVARPDFTSWPPTRNFDALIVLSDTDPRLRSGMSGSARIELDRLADVLVVPSAAIFQRDGVALAYVVEGATTDARPVTILRRGRDHVVVSGGLREGERIALKEPDSAAR